jgi:hypothetical protein
LNIPSFRMLVSIEDSQRHKASSRRFSILPFLSPLHSAFTDPHFSTAKNAILFFLGFRVRRCCGGQQIRISFRRTI